MSRLSMSLFSLAVVLALIALATNINAKDSYHLLSHHRRQHPPQQQPDQHQQDHIHHGHHHHPTLAGALFPVANEILAGKKEYAKEPCPTGCVHHRSDVYLAVTSIGEGFPRIQFTCSHAQPSQPTANAQYLEGNHQHYQQYHAHHGHGHGQGDSSNQEPADPIPEHTPHVPSHQGCSKYNHHDPHDRTDDGANIYTTADPHLRRSTSMDHNAAAAGGRFNPHYDFIFSPRERSHSVDLNDDAKSHTTTMMFSADDNKHNEYVASYERRSIPLTDAADDEQDPHHQQVHILPIRDRHRPRHDAALPDSLVKSGGSRSITPEPIATLAAPTSSSYPRDGLDRGVEGVNDRTVSKVAPVLHGHGHEYKAGPAAPTPEAFPGQINTGHIHTHDHNYNQGDVFIDGKERAVGRDGGETPMPRYRTIVHRVTTLIIETETIVNRPTATPTATAMTFMQRSKGQDRRTQHHYNKKGEQLGRGSHAYGPHVGDHIMFDAGVDGEVVVSIASSDQSSRRSKHKTPLAH
ncbi:hypothetical protein BGZ47_005341 [Haplosporangium gracile]|nr:hypothetical protein BGZ47_005341 [Haplosporangium gracile]